MTDVIVIGAGPAGMTAAIYLARAGKSVLVFEGNKVGGTLRKLKKIVNYPGSISDDGAEISGRMESQMLMLNVKVIGEFVSQVHKTQDGFEVFTDRDSYSTRYVIYCGGIVHKRPKAEEKFKGSGISYCAVCDGNFYKGKTVAVIGDGEAAKKDIEYLLPLCKKVYHVYTETPVSGAEAVRGTVDEFLGETTLSGISVGGKIIEVDGVFVAMGGTSDKIIKGLELKDGLILNDKGKTNISGFFVAGDACHDSMRQVVSACFEGARAATYCK